MCYITCLLACECVGDECIKVIDGDGEDQTRRGWVDGPWAVKTEHGILDREAKRQEDRIRMANTWHGDE